MGTQASKTEIDSYMFQSVGTETAKLISVCMELPLIQEVIEGTSE
jgi:diphthamide synthase (EF-2-diphthine--ammonia ligase)